jgi:hypothetical protein
MPSKTLVVLMAVAIVGVSSTAMAKGGGGGGGKGGSSHGGMAMHGHGHFDHRQFDHRFRFVNRFNKNPLFLSGWGWGDWGWGGYGDSGYGGNTTVVVFPQAVPQVAKGDPAPCNWNQQEFTVQSSAGGTRPVQVVSCH